LKVAREGEGKLHEGRRRGATKLQASIHHVRGKALKRGGLSMLKNAKK